jgi:hypothetical protein
LRVVFQENVERSRARAPILRIGAARQEAACRSETIFAPPMWPVAPRFEIALAAGKA